MEHIVIIQPYGIKTHEKEGKSILNALQNVGIPINAYCGGGATCGKCFIKVLEGDFKKYQICSKFSNLSNITDIERKKINSDQINQGYRLACAANIHGDVVIDLSVNKVINSHVILKDENNISVNLKPAVSRINLKLEKGSLKDQTDDLTRLKKAVLEELKEQDLDIDDITVDFKILRKLPDILREGNWQVSVYLLYRRKIIGVVPGYCKKTYGVAIDIGTTTIAASLCDMENGDILQTESFVNPQVGYGDDVISRISYCMQYKEGKVRLQNLIIDRINECLKDMALMEGIKPEEISEVVFVFNTVMEAVTLGITADYIGKSPFCLPISSSLDILADKIGIDIMDGGNIHCLPAKAGFIGADHISVLLAKEPHLKKEMQLIIDIGTNSEICLGNENGLYVTSCATGPAFEGAQIEWGMRASKGAIEGVEINPSTLEPNLKIIGGDVEPVGICGSGIIDVIAQMAITGIIEPNGRFNKKIINKRIRENALGKKEYVLYFSKNDKEKDITISIKDIRAVQLAKAALYTGAKILMRKCNIEKVDKIILAGAFGRYLNQKNALLLGMIPDCSLDKIEVAGNAAAEGARIALLNIDKRKETQTIISKIKYIETAMEEEFQKEFTEAMYIPHKRDKWEIKICK